MSNLLIALLLATTCPSQDILPQGVWADLFPSLRTATFDQDNDGILLRGPNGYVYVSIEFGGYKDGSPGANTYLWWAGVFAALARFDNEDRPECAPCPAYRCQRWDHCGNLDVDEWQCNYRNYDLWQFEAWYGVWFVQVMFFDYEVTASQALSLARSRPSQSEPGPR